MLQMTISINPKFLKELDDLTQKNAEDAINELRDEVEQIWRVKAVRVLQEKSGKAESTSLSEYLRHLNVSISKDKKGLQLSLGGDNSFLLPAKVEAGMPNGFSLRTTILKGRTSLRVPIGSKQGVSCFRTISAAKKFRDKYGRFRKEPVHAKVDCAPQLRSARTMSDSKNWYHPGILPPRLVIVEVRKEIEKRLANKLKFKGKWKSSPAYDPDFWKKANKAAQEATPYDHPTFWQGSKYKSNISYKGVTMPQRIFWGGK